MSKPITLKDISNEITLKDAASMIEMESGQTSDWRTLFNGMSYEQKNEYFGLKEQILNKQFFLQFSKENIKRDYLAFYHQGVTKGNFSYTVEHFLDEVNSDMDLEKIKIHYGYDAYKIVKYLREIRDKKETFTFFWETNSPFSQWHKSKFQGSSALFLNENEREKILGHNKAFLEFTSAEQFMMYHKAMLFLNTEIAGQILKVSNPRDIKDLGRQVNDFDEDVWSFFRSKVVYEANKAKFSQNNILKDALMLTKGTTLVEAAPNDAIWGIGLIENDPQVQNRKTWKGKNLLGEILTILRIEFMGTY